MFILSFTIGATDICRKMFGDPMKVVEELLQKWIQQRLVCELKDSYTGKVVQFSTTLNYIGSLTD